MSGVYVKSLLAQLITSPQRRTTLRNFRELKRKLSGRAHEVHYFHRVDDPYAHLMVQGLADFQSRFEIKLIPHVIERLDMDMYPEPDMLAEYSAQDANVLAARDGYEFPVNGKGCDKSRLQEYSAYLAQCKSEEDFLETALNVGDAYWNDHEFKLAKKASVYEAQLLRDDEALLKKLGHYLSATLYYAGEWYWGVDRLHYLEARLSDMGLQAMDHTSPRLEKNGKAAFVSNGTDKLVYYFSARSPYSYIGYFKARKLSDQLGLELELKPVLPMMMRGMKVPTVKRFYILTDAKREAESFGIPFGNIADPLGAGVERVYAIADYARKNDKLYSWIDVVFPAIFAKGIDLATDRGLRTVCQEAGISWQTAKVALSSNDWQAWVEQNRRDMTETGCWGVPVLQFGDISAWGQDRFWLIEDAAALDRG